MIGVVNPNATETYDAQLAFAQNVTYQLGPGDPFPSETPLPKTTTTAPAGSSSTSSSSSSSSSASSNRSGGLSTGTIAGIAIGAAALLVLTAALIYLCGRHGGFDKAYRNSALRSSSVPEATSAAAADASPDLGMVEARYANGGDAFTKSPGQTKLASSTATGFDGSSLRSSGGGIGNVRPSAGYGLGFVATGLGEYGGQIP
jgi:hypothetical protein